MSEQPEALRLADALNEKPDSDGHCREAAAELRRLHEVNQELLEALKLALEALEYWHVRDEFSTQTSKAITAIREALAEQPAQQQEPVAYLTEDGDRVVTAKTYNSAKKDGGAMWSTMRPFCVPVYTSPPASKPKNVMQVKRISDQSVELVFTSCAAASEFEAKLREKNA